MKSTWVAAGLLLVTICQTANLEVPDPSPSTTPIPALMAFTSMEKTGPNSFEICFDKLMPDLKTAYLISQGPPQKIIENIDPGQSSCVTFGLVQPTSHADVSFIFHGLDKHENLTYEASAYINKFPEFPTGLKISLANDPLPLANGNQMLRVEGDMKNMDIKKLESNRITNTASNINYYVDIDPSVFNNPLYLYEVTEPDKVQVCEMAVIETTTTDPGPKVTSAILTYSYESSAVNDLPVVSAHVSVAAETEDSKSTTMEIIVADDTLDPKLCVNGTFATSLSCDISWETPGDGIVHMRVIGIDGKLMKETSSNLIKDRGMVITVLEKTILEGSWLMHEDSQDLQNYRLMLNNKVTNEDNTVDVDCTGVTLSHCFGYFPSVDDGIHTITITNTLNGASPVTYNELEQIESEPKQVSKAGLSHHLQIHVLPMEWHQNLMEVNTTICFSHETPNEEMIFSHYEMLLINTRGQWLKHKVMEEDNNDDLCFTPFTINTQELDVTEGVKVVVSQRASDGFSVIASGGSPLF